MEKFAEIQRILLLGVILLITKRVMYKICLYLKLKDLHNVPLLAIGKPAKPYCPNLCTFRQLWNPTPLKENLWPQCAWIQKHCHSVATC